MSESRENKIRGINLNIRPDIIHELSQRHALAYGLFEYLWERRTDDIDIMRLDKRAFNYFGFGGSYGGNLLSELVRAGYLYSIKHKQMTFYSLVEIEGELEIMHSTEFRLKRTEQ